MASAIFDTLNGEHKDHERRAQSFDRDMKKAVRLLMERKEGRVFLRWLGYGQSSMQILQLLMDYEEEKYVS